MTDPSAPLDGIRVIDFTHVLATQMYSEAFVNYRLGYGASVGVLMSITMLIFSVIYFMTVFRKSVGQL